MVDDFEAEVPEGPFCTGTHRECLCGFYCRIELYDASVLIIG